MSWMFFFFAFIHRKFIYWRIKLIQLIKTQWEFSDLSLNGVRPIKLITITEPRDFHTRFLHVYRFYYSSDKMISLRRSLWIIYEDSFAIFLKQYPFVFTSNRSPYLYLVLISTKTSFQWKKYTGDTGQRRRDYVSQYHPKTMRYKLQNVHFIHIELCVYEVRDIVAFSWIFALNLVTFELSHQLYFLVCILIAISLERNLLRNKKIFK